MVKTKRYGIYTRVGTSEQSTKAQKSELRKYAENRGWHLRTLIVLLTETGLRVNKEALSLRWEDIDFSEFTAFRTWFKNNYWSKDRRTVPLSEPCKKICCNGRNRLAQSTRRIGGMRFESWVSPKNKQRAQDHLLLRQLASSTVNETVPAVVGVPEIAPVDAAKLNPIGSVPTLKLQL